MADEFCMPLTPAVPTRHGQVIDAHVHLFTVGLLQEYVDSDPTANARFAQAVKDRRFGRRNDVLPDMTPSETACWYVERLAAADVTKALVVSVVPDNQWTREFIAAANGHIGALASIDPRSQRAPEQLEREMSAGFLGVKLLPVNRRYHLSDPACRPFFEKAAELRAPMIVHYGVTVDPNGDLRYADPIDLSPVARDYPEIEFVIAHFGAGWLDSVLRVAYQCANVSVDSSGTNNWLDYHVPKMTLGEVFERCLTALGPQRVLFGTDSNTTAPYRTWIRRMQQRTLEELGLSADDLDAVMRGNAARIFHIDD
ncbi:MAG: amidohydrolase family protein [Coriobacteriia bacterium]|nr:amidohydrolase family protein [Coriobacteriia bacterium]